MKELLEGKLYILLIKMITIRHNRVDKDDFFINQYILNELNKRNNFFIHRLKN